MTKKWAKASNVVKKTTTTIKKVAPIMNVPRTLYYTGPAPRSIDVKLKYVEFWSTPGTVYDYTFRTNSMFDPNFTGGGHQPFGRDQWATLYKSYKVMGCRYTIYLTSIVATNHLVTAIPNTSTTAITSVYEAIEGYAGKTHLLIAYTPTIIKGKVNNAKLLGMKKQQYKDDPNTGALLGANPTQELALHVLTSTMSPSAPAAGDVSLAAKIEFDVHFYDPVSLATS